MADVAVRARTRAHLWVAAAPERIVQVIVALSLAAGLTVTLGQFRPWTVLPLAALLVAATWRPFRPRVSATDVSGARLALIAAAGWAALNWVLTSEFLIVVRDPGFLTLSGVWLSDHPSTDIPVLGADEAAAVQSNMLADASQAWNLSGDMIQPQGAKMLPATIAVGGWVAGIWGVLGFNILIGTVGLLAVYALGRHFLGPRVALAPMCAFGLTVAHIALSRSAYSEPLTALLVVAAILWAWRGLRERSTALVVAGSLLAGATTLIRIDGALFAAGAALGIVVALALSDAARTWRIRAAVLSVAFQGAAVWAGYWSLERWSTAYWERLAPQTESLIKVYLLIAGVLLVWAIAWLSPLRADRLLSAPFRSMGVRGAQVLGGLVMTVLLVLASRPLWTTVHRGTTDPVDIFTNSVVQYFQESQGLPVDPTRTYAESTVAWVSYYLTWPLVLLAILGFGIATYRAARGRGEWAVFLGATLVPSLLYFWAPEIVPDQVWAIRRFEPMTLPAFALAATLAAIWLAKRFAEPRRRRLATAWAVWLTALLPLSTWVIIDTSLEYGVRGPTPLVIREMGGSLDQMNELCAIAPGHPIVLAGTSSHFGSLRVMCDEPVVLALSAPTKESLAQMAQIFGEQPVVLTRDTTWFEWQADPSVLVSSTVRQSGYQLGGLPRTYIDRDYEWYAGLVTDDGTLAPITE
ncbi:hypothetical protein [Demequina sp.]|uniref:hypothetical protein n=1 Tax=Demequina sp. TaxID=2050685 RepID=UPI003D1036CF